MTGIISIEKIEQNAKAAADQGRSVLACPYPPDSDAALRWKIAYSGRLVSKRLNKLPQRTSIPARGTAGFENAQGEVSHV